MCFIVLGNGHQSTSCDCNLRVGWKIGDPLNEFVAIAFVDMAEDKSTWLDLTRAGSCFVGELVCLSWSDF